MREIQRNFKPRLNHSAEQVGTSSVTVSFDGNMLRITIQLETLICEDGSGVVKTTRPNKYVEKTKHESGSQNAVIKLSDASHSDQDEEPFVMPLALEKKSHKIAPPPEETASEPEDSEVPVEQKLRRKVRSLTVTRDKVR